jgi:hypothetical protein
VLPSPHDARIRHRNLVPPRQPWTSFLSNLFGETCKIRRTVVAFSRRDRQAPRRGHGPVLLSVGSTRRCLRFSREHHSYEPSKSRCRLRKALWKPDVRYPSLPAFILFLRSTPLTSPALVAVVFGNRFSKSRTARKFITAQSFETLILRFSCDMDFSKSRKTYTIEFSRILILHKLHSFTQ